MRRALAFGMVLAFGGLLIFTVTTNLLTFGKFPQRPFGESARIGNVLSYENAKRGEVADAFGENRVQTFVGNWGEPRFSIFYRENDNVGAGYENLIQLDSRTYLIEFAVDSVGKQILEEAPEKTGATNVVTSVVWGYRGYDTLGEATVLFTAVVGVIMVFRASGGGSKWRG